MLSSFNRYFVGYLFKAKTRQRLLIFAIAGLFLSSFALMWIQGVMNGLQHGLVSKSKEAMGEFSFHLSKFDQNKLKEFSSFLALKDIDYYKEYEIELLMKHDNFLSPVVLHGIDFNDKIPPFLENRDLSGLVIGIDLASKLKAYHLAELSVVSPVHTDLIFTEVPRQMMTTVSDVASTDLFELDSTNAWVRLSFVQNLVRERRFNKYVFADQDDLTIVKNYLIQMNLIGLGRIETWAQKNKNLNWALNLETTMMIFLFTSMALLVTVTIVSGFLSFFNKIKIDLVTFWVSGMSNKQIQKHLFRFVLSLVFLSCFFGVLFGQGVLYALDNMTFSIFPDIFVNGKLPIRVTLNSSLLALFLPLSIASVFSFVTYLSFKKSSHDHISLLRNRS